MARFPFGYLTTVNSAKLGTATINCNLGDSIQGCPGPTEIKRQLMACATTVGAVKGVQSLVLQIGGFSVGPKNADEGTSIWTASALGAIIDTVGTGSVPAMTVGGSGSGTGTATASVPADMILGTATTGTFTLSFKIETLLPVNTGKIHFRLTPGYLTTGAAPLAATLSGGSTSTCSSVALVPGNAASGCSAARQDTLTCNVATANLAAGSYSLVLTLNTWSVGANQPAGTFSVSTTNNNVALDAASTTVGSSDWQLCFGDFFHCSHTY
jgi:hypothetical protein